MLQDCEANRSFWGRRRLLGARLKEVAKSDVAKDIEEKLQFRILSYDYAIVLDLFEREQATAGELLARSGAASTTFYAKLKGLVNSGLIATEQVSADKRKIAYRLAPGVRETVAAEFRQVMDWVGAKIDNKETESRHLVDFLRSTRAKLKILFFTCEYQTILHLYDRSECSAGDLRSLCDVSDTKFYTSLKALDRSGLICSAQEESDHRRRNYTLTPWVRVYLDDAHRQLHDWMRRALSS